jgi:UDP-N-acetylmuramoyl-tripeptide--D-alanyl-D-alanine ligase
MRSMKNIVLLLVELQVKRFLKRHKPKIVAVTGSVGKTSTKLAITTVLGQRFKVLFQEGNYNAEVSVPMTIFDLPMPPADKLKNPFEWLKQLWYMDVKIRKPFNFDVIVLELGTDKPGDIEHFRKYLRPDIGVVTAVTPEHMEFFKTIDAVAQEELAVANFSELIIINRDDIDETFARYVNNSNIDTYGTSGVAEYHYLIENFEPGKGFSGKFVSPEFGEQQVSLNLAGEHNIKAAVAAGVVGIKMGLGAQEIVNGLTAIKPVNGRMNLLRGLLDSVIIDDTYNSSPAAAVAALQTLYLFPSKQKIAIMGSMNELGEFSQKAHEQVGAMCDPTLLDWVVTIGDDAAKFLAPAAANRGCQIRSFTSPYEAGAFVHSVLHPNATVLAKGSQNKVFAEEAVKILLHSTEDEKQLVRQGAEWLEKKEAMFDRFAGLETPKG